MKQRVMICIPTPISAETGARVRDDLQARWPDLDVVVISGASNAVFVPSPNDSPLPEVTLRPSGPYTPQPIPDEAYAEHRRSK